MIKNDILEYLRIKVTSSAIDKNSKCTKNLETNLENKLEIYSYFKLEKFGVFCQWMVDDLLLI